ncbi:MAG: PilZ domain-containing protein [Candidatus Omnitrophica bacterium]|nr:PilZ domain-containing protein [Candidatus Omnitrophota bacterium]
MPKKNPLGKEKRKHRRIKVNLSVIYRVARPTALRMSIGNHETRATMLDLSIGGIAVLTNYDIPQGTQLLIKFTLFSVETEDVIFYGPMNISGEVRYNMPLGANEYRLGIYFKHIDKEDQEQIAQFIKSQIAHFLPA